MQVKIKKVREGAMLPVYATNGSGGFDFYAGEDTVVHGATIIPLGVALEVPQGYVMLIVPRSSIGFKTTLRMANSIGVIDSDYRGEVGAIYESKEATTVLKGTRIAQGFIVKVPTVEFVEVSELSSTDRGTGGYGSTGK